MKGVLRNIGYYLCFLHNNLILYQGKEGYNKVAL